MTQVIVVRMWEARVEPGRLAVAEAWVTEVAASAREAGCLHAEGFVAVASEERVVLLTRWAGEPAWTEPAAPAGLLARAHAWHFHPLKGSDVGTRPP